MSVFDQLLARQATIFLLPRMIPFAVYSGNCGIGPHHKEKQMLSIAAHCRVYDPEAVNTMGWAVNQAFEGLPEESKRKPYIHRDLALCILRLYDEGEHKPLRLSKMALATITIVTASARKHVSNEGIARKLSVVRISSGRPALTL